MSSFGFIPGAWDKRNLDYPMRATLERVPKPPRTWRYWSRQWEGNQQQTSRCVAFMGTAHLKNGPVTQPALKPTDSWIWDLYRAAQARDPWGKRSSDDGTTLSALYSELSHQGYIKGGYSWAKDAPTIVEAILHAGPVGIGIPWHEGMDEPDKDGLIYPTGRILGYHAVLLTGVNVARGLVRGQNSWGREWGDRGHFWLALADLDKLVSDRWAESCLALEVRP